MSTINLNGRVTRIALPGRKGSTLMISVLCHDNTLELQNLLSKKVKIAISENGHEQLQTSLIEESPVKNQESETIVVPGQPIGKPRQTQRDRWQQRPCVLRYRQWCDAARRAAQGKIPKSIEGITVRAYFAMPDSWSNEKKLHQDGKRHYQKPDWDNIGKAASDALIENDEIIAIGHVEKFWTLGEPRTEITFY